MRAFAVPTEGGATLSRRAYGTNSTLDISEISDSFSDFFDTLCSMFGDMESSDTERDERHDYTADAARLLAVLEARVARRNGFLQKQVTGAGEQGEEPTQPAPDAVRRSERSRRLNRSADGM